MLTEEQKILSNTDSLSFPRNHDNKVFDVCSVSVRPATFDVFFNSTWSTNILFSKTKADIYEEMIGLKESDRTLLVESLRATHKMNKPKTANRSRKEASTVEKRQYAKQFLDAKLAEYKSWVDNDVFDLVDSRKLKGKQNFVTGRWVLTIKRDKDGNFVKCKARWVLRGFQDTQKDTQQTDSPAATRPGFRLMTTIAANHKWDLKHIDLKTAFLQNNTTRPVLRVQRAGWCS